MHRTVFVVTARELTACLECATAKQARAIDALVRYHRAHQRWMQYDRYRAQGMPIGNGIVRPQGPASPRPSPFMPTTRSFRDVTSQSDASAPPRSHEFANGPGAAGGTLAAFAQA